MYYYFSISIDCSVGKRKIMAPNASDVNGVLFENDAATPDMALPTPPRQHADNRPKQLVWRNILLFAYLHLAALYGGYLFLTSAKWQTDIFGKIIILCLHCHNDKTSNYLKIHIKSHVMYV